VKNPGWLAEQARARLAGRPHTTVTVLGPEELHAGDEEVRELLAKVVECTRTGEWPGRCETSEVPLKLPAWFFAAAEDAAGALGLVVEGEEV
jgi:hypothetical protein